MGFRRGEIPNKRSIMAIHLPETGKEDSLEDGYLKREVSPVVNG